MKKYTYLVNFDSQTLERAGESFAVKGDGGIAELEFIIPSNFGVPANQALWRVFFKLPGEKESLFETLPTVAATQSGDYVTAWAISKAITQKAGRLAFSLAAISGNDVQWNSRTVILQVPESQYQPESEEAEEPYTGRLTALEGDMAAIRGEFGDVVDEFEELKETATLGTPVPKSLASEMVEGGVYLYTGSETGYTAGHVYYYVNGTLTDGGQYGGTTVDATLTVSGAAADAKVTGDKIAEIKEDLSTYLTAITGGEPVIFTRNRYYVYSLQGTKVSLTPTSFDGRVCALSPCVAGDRYIITLQGGGGVALGWSFCDEAGNVLTRSATNVIVNNALITAPAGSRYAVFNDTHQSETVYAIKITGKSNSRLLDVADLKVIAFGDSICRGGRNRNKGFIGDVGCKYVNMGVGGATLSNVTDSTASTDSVHPVGAANIPDQLIKYAESSAESWYMEPDVIIAEGGTNDYPRSALGTIPTSAVRTDADAEALDRSTVMGGLAYMFYSMVKLYPMAYRFFLLTNRLAKRPWTAGAMGYTQTELNNAIRAVCKLYGVKVIDVFSDSPVDSFFSQYVSPTAYTADPTVTDLYCIDSDQVHPLALGYKIGYAPFVREALATAIRFS